MAIAFYSRRIFLTRPSFLRSSKRFGYVVMVPEIGEDLPEKNPLIPENGLPEFNNVTVEKCMAAIGKQTLDYESGIKDIENSIINGAVRDVFKDVIEPLEDLGAPLDVTWGLSKTLYLGNSTLMPTKNYIAIHERAKRARASKFNSIPIYKIIKEELGESQHRTEEQKRVIHKFVLEGKLNSLELEDKNKRYFEASVNELTSEKTQFRTKVDVATKMFYHRIIHPDTVRDFPQELLSAMAVEPDKWLNGPWLVTLEPHIFIPFMEYCPDRVLRWNVWQAMVSRGSGYNEKEFRTSVHLEEIRVIRSNQAELLGYNTFADMSMETKMAGTTNNVHSMIDTLLKYAKSAQERELSDLYNFAAKRGFEGTRIELWDFPYWKRKQRNALFNYQEDQFKQYFPLPKVLEGLFQLCEKLFNIIIKQRTGVSTWHKDVRYYEIFEPGSTNPVAGFYFDPYARTDEKIRISQNRGWMVGIQNGSLVTNIKPLAALIFNFQSPTLNKHSLLTFEDVNSLFFKFGYALQHLMSRTTYSEVSGLSNLEWDVVEVCGHVLSHWLYTKSVIHSISSHCDSEQELPDDMFETLLNIRKHAAGVDLCRELYLSALDLELYSSKDFWLDIVKRLWPQFRCFPLEKIDSHPCSFTQIFTEEWAAAYYSHVWARVIAADIYSAFHEVQNNDAQVIEVGKRFRDTFLALGGSLHPSEVFRKFRGRDPCPKALLSSLNLKQAKSATS